MIKSMTGFGSKEQKLAVLGKISVEIRSFNHKFLDIVLHLPEGLLSLEGRIKKEIEARIKRGRVTAVISIAGAQLSGVILNKHLLKNYLSAIKNMGYRSQIKDGLSLDTLIRLPGVLSLAESVIPKEKIWPHLKVLVKEALQDLLKMREKEGRAIFVYLKKRVEALELSLDKIKKRFKNVLKERLAQAKTDEEKSALLKDIDVSEEIERLTFHIRNFMHKLSKLGPMGKELDFVAQEMQREINTMGAKSCDKLISAIVVQIKSQIEKIREQVQNIE